MTELKLLSQMAHYSNITHATHATMKYLVFLFCMCSKRST